MAILTLLFTIVVSYIIIYLISIMDASIINEYTSVSFDNILEESPRLIFANIVTILYSLILNSKLYYYLKKMKNTR